MQVEFKESGDKDSYLLIFTSKVNKDKYADIEFFNNGEILMGKTNRIDIPEIRDIAKGNIYDVIKELVEYMNES